MKNLAVIPARSGSKGLPDKNIRPLEGKPLMAYSIEAARQSGMFDTVHVSTDSEKYAAIAREYGAEAPFLRSRENAADTASSWDMLLEVLQKYEENGKYFDTIMMLQPTSPLRTAEDIQAAYTMMAKKGAATVVSVCEAEHPPFWSNILPDDYCMDGFLGTEFLGPRQKAEKYFRLNGAIYLFTVKDFQKKGRIAYDAACFASIMPAERSVDIDTPLDFLFAETILKGQTKMQGL